MARETLSSHSLSSPGPETMGQLPHPEMTPVEFKRLTSSYIASIKVIEVPRFNIDQGYNADLLRVSDKLVVGEGGKLQQLPQFRVQLGSHLSSAERGQALVREVIGLISQDQIGKKGPVSTTLAEVKLRASRIEVEMQEFYENNKNLVDGYIDSMLLGESDSIPQQELLV